MARVGDERRGRGVRGRTPRQQALGMATRLRGERSRHGWSQAELAERTGLSRAEVSAIETGRVTPNVRAALALARALGADVETLFGEPGLETTWAWPPPKQPARAWLATVAGRRVAIPCEPVSPGILPHDTTCTSSAGVVPDAAQGVPTLVVAGCDPAIGLLEALLRERGVRVLALVRSSARALELLRQGVVHVAGVHLSGSGSDSNVRAVRASAGSGYRLLRWANWEEGVVFGPDTRLRSSEARALGKLSWVGREEGSGARRCLDALFRGSHAPRYTAMGLDHRDVARAVRLGVAEAGVCVRLAADEAGLGFVPLRAEPYDLCFKAENADEPLVRELMAVVQGARFRRLLGEIPGYDTKQTGRVEAVA